MKLMFGMNKLEKYLPTVYTHVPTNKIKKNYDLISPLISLLYQHRLRFPPTLLFNNNNNVFFSFLQPVMAAQPMAPMAVDFAEQPPPHEPIPTT